MEDHIFIIGSGGMAQAIAFDLLHREPRIPVVVLDRDKTALDRLATFTGRDNLQTIVGDAEDESLLLRLMSRAKVSIGAASYRYHYSSAKTAVYEGSHWLDLGGNPDVVKQQFSLHTDAVKAGVSVIPDCGLAPGMVNTLAAGIVSQMDTIEEIHIRVGGLPQTPREPLFYGLVFSPEGLANEYYEPTWVIEEGAIKQVESLTGWERVHIGPPLGSLEAFHTAGGSSTLVDTYNGKLKTLDYKTLRYPGHLRRIKLLKDLGLFSTDEIRNGFPSGITPRFVLGKLLEKHIGWVEDDLVALKIWATGRKNNQSIKNECQMIDYSDTETSLSAMARTTGFPAAIIARMLVDGRISDRGVLYQEKSIPVDGFIEELKSRGINIHFNSTTLQP